MSAGNVHHVIAVSGSLVAVASVEMIVVVRNVLRWF